jgi:hypothetical protein
MRSRKFGGGVSYGRWEGPVPALEHLKKSPYLAPLTDHFEVVFDYRTRDLQRALNEALYDTDFTHSP